VCGISHNGSNYDSALTRYNSDGTLDTSFGGGDGIVTTAIGSSQDYGQSVTVQSDGKILIGGYSFNGSSYEFTLTRYNADGMLDTGFGGGDGIATTDIGSGNDYGRSVTVQSDGKILVGGYSHNGSNNDFALVRYNSDGTLDTDFDPVTTLDGTPTFIEGGAAVVLDMDVDVSDSDLDALNGGVGNYDGASLTLVRNGGASTEDVFSNSGLLGTLSEGGALIYNGTTIGTVTTNSAGTLVLTFNTNATSALVDSTLQSIAYSNSSDTPPATAQIDWSFDDGDGSDPKQATGSTTVTITATNDTPTLAASAANDSLTENIDTTSAAVFSTVTIDPIETGDDIASAQLTIAGGIENSDTLTINGTAITGLGSDSSGAITGGHSYSYTQATGVVTVTFAGSTNAAAAELVLENITYGIDASDQDPSTTARTVTLNTVTDNGGGADTNTDISETATISVGAVNDAIAINVDGNTVLFTEGAGATTSLFNAAIDTIETTDTVTQLVLTMADIESGDTISFGAIDIDLNTNGATGPDGNGFTYTVSNAGASAVVTITHVGTDDGTVNTMLGSATFNNTTNENPSTTARTVTLTSVTDSGSGTTLDGTVATVNVAAVNDAPVNTIPGLQSIPEDTPLTFSTAGGNAVSVADDAGAGDIIKVTLSIGDNASLTLTGISGAALTGWTVTPG
ncbi:MAG: hypothetical protein GY926_18420, partial [bacterium]|nr:hypothetical protein [bacterium]